MNDSGILMRDEVINDSEPLRRKLSNVLHRKSMMYGGSVLSLMFVVSSACTSEMGEVPGPILCASTGSRPEFVTATYNIHSGVGRDGTRNIRRIAAALVDAQLIGLQEVDNGRMRSGFVNQAKEIAMLLDHSYWKHFQAEQYWPLGSYGNALSTSFPVAESGMFDLPIVQGKALRRMGWVKFLVDCRPIHAFTIHVTRTDEIGNGPQAQIRAALDWIAQKTDGMKEPGILMGDLNSAPQDPGAKLLQRHLIEATPQNLSDALNASRRDYIFIWGDLELVESHLKDDGSSDHPSVFATLR